MTSEWDRKFIELARHVATWSKDPSTKVGAVIVGQHKTEVALGYNGFPPRIADTPGRLNTRETKYRLIVHAERNVLDNARFDVRCGTLYTTLPPCNECAKSIITRGILRVAALPMSEEQDRRWGASVDNAEALFREAGVALDILARP